MTLLYVPAPPSARRLRTRDRQVVCNRTSCVFAMVRMGAETSERETVRPGSQSRSAKLMAQLAGALLAGALICQPGEDVTLGAPVLPAHAAGGSGAGGGATFANASSFVNKDAESLLRWALPIENKPLREAQKALEEVAYEMRRLQFGKADDSLRKFEGILERKQKEIVAKYSSEAKQAQAAAIIKDILSTLPSVREPLAQKNTDAVVTIQRSLLRKIGDLELMLVDKFPYEIPSEYKNLPVLKGRATVEVTVRRPEKRQFDIGGELFDEGKMTMVIDGFSAPITGGNFVDLVQRGFYNGKKIIRSDGFVIQTGKPEGSDEGFVDPATKELRTIPLEIFPKKERMPIYGDTLEELGRGAQATVLPFTSYGTLAQAREEFSNDSGSSQFFWFLFEPDLTPAGRNLLDGTYAVFGYTVEGNDFLRDLKEGDYIESAKVVDGLENLQAPKA
ncbi:Peptidyl-prolyl cis-trans isomerase CYP38, chloroplastic [Porphyridium purpureum]|uniref:peptidylprolyl isomerase n=1 Tax=Porphyridium purpureum TaxID=35688 RepID=A0A5J4YQC6_PORPP|nr:Peptidyl-prolyl cis-trans isomerase CYP38, chloroplastic [Porphyridium purpureum]|eukprot:POR0154..scf236_6